MLPNKIDGKIAIKNLRATEIVENICHEHYVYFGTVWSSFKDPSI